MLLKRRRCSILYNHWDVFLRYCFKILGLSNCVVCLQESSEQGWKKDRVLKRSEFTHIRFYIEINQKWSDFILVLFFLFNLSLFLHIWQILSSLYIISFQSRRFLFLILPDTCQWCFFSCFSSSFFLSLFAFSHYFCDISCRFPFFPQFLFLFCSVFLYLWTVFIFLFFYFLFLFFVLFAVCPVSFHGCVTLSLFAGRASWSWTHWNCRTTTTSADSSESEFHLRTHRGQKTNQTHIYQ